MSINNSSTKNGSPPLEDQLLAALEQGDLAMLLASPPVAFQRVFVDLTGSVTAALLLSACMQEHESRASSDGWFTASSEQWERATGMSRKEQATARRVLRDQRLTQERRVGYPAALQIRIDYDEITRSLLTVGARSRVSRARTSAQDLH